MNRILWLWLLCSLGLALAEPFGLEPGSSVVYRASAGDLDRWSGRAPLERLTLDLNPEKPLGAQFTVVLRPERFDSGNGLRDSNARSQVFRSAQYPEIRFRSSRITGEGAPLKAGETRKFRAVGLLTVTDITREVSVPLTVRWTGSRLEVEAGFGFTLSSFRLARPQILWIQVDDALTLEVKFGAVPQ